MGILDKPHTDWIWPFSLVPRRWTAFQWGKPELVKGNLPAKDFVFSRVELRDDGFWAEKSPKPISSPETWQLSRFPSGPFFAWYFAWSGKRGADGLFRHFRVGARWDDVDGYVNFPSIAFRRYTGDDSQNTEA